MAVSVCHKAVLTRRETADQRFFLWTVYTGIVNTANKTWFFLSLNTEEQAAVGQSLTGGLSVSRR